MEPSLRDARSALAAGLKRGDVAAADAFSADDAQVLRPAAGLIQGRKTIDATFERGTFVVLHRQAVDGTWQRADDVLDPDEPEGSSPHSQGGKQ